MKKDSRTIRAWPKAALWLSAWGLAFLLCILPPTRYYSVAEALKDAGPLILWFPTGLVAAVCRLLSIKDLDPDAQLAISLWVGWPIYLALTVAMFCIKNRKVFTLLLLALIALLACNVGGCRATFNQ